MTARNRGVKNFKARLTETQVIAIYRAKGTKTQQELADKYNVRKPTIASIHTGRSWAWLTARIIRSEA